MCRRTTAQIFHGAQLSLAHRADGRSSKYMSTMKPTSAKIMHHAEGLGAPDAETVRRRAQELALINGREQYSEADWRDAKRELHGGHDSNDTNGNMDMTVMISEHDMVIGSV